MADLGIPGIGDATLIASGGSALVYMATSGWGETVAIKVLRGMRGTEITRRFEREQSAAQRLNEHPNIIDVYGSGITETGEPYLVLPLQGGSLQDELDETGPLPVERAVADVATAAHAIDYAHSRGVLHRDIKPANLLRAADGSIVVTDFGIARVKDAGITSATVGAATPLYAAPELLAENEVSVHSEVYSLGALLYALLAGKPAFADTDNIWATMNRIRTEPVPPIEGVPAPVMRVIEQAMAKDPANRPAGAGLFASYLSASLDAPHDWEPPRPAPVTEPLPAPPPPMVPVVSIEPADPGETAELEAPPVPDAYAPLGSGVRGTVLRTAAALAAVALVGALGWFGVNALFDGETTATANPDGPVDTSLPSPSSPDADTTPSSLSPPPPTEPPAEPTVEPTEVPMRLVSFSGEHFTALLPEGWSVISQDVDVGYGYRTRFVDGQAYLNIDTTPAERRTGDEDIETSARSIAASISSASAVRTESVDGLTLYSFTFRNNQGIQSIDIFFEIDGDGYAIVAGSDTDPQQAFLTARQVALTVRGTP